MYVSSIMNYKMFFKYVGSLIIIIIIIINILI